MTAAAPTCFKGDLMSALKIITQRHDLTMRDMVSAYAPAEVGQTPFLPSSYHRVHRR